MKLYGIASTSVKTDALFYIQASSRQQADFVFTQILKNALSGRCQVMKQSSGMVIPSISRITLWLRPWAQNPLVSTRQLTMSTHGLNLSGTVTPLQMNQIVAFCDDLNLPLCESESDLAWTVQINAECARLNPPRLYPVQIDLSSDKHFQIYVVAPAGEESGALIEDVMQEYFPDRSYRVTGEQLMLNKPPIITLESYRSDTGEVNMELTFCSQGLTLSATIFENQLRFVLMLCEDFGIKLQGRAEAMCHPGIRDALRHLTVVGICSRSGAEIDRRPYSSKEERNLIQGLMRKGLGAVGLEPARHGVTFNGVIFNATPSGATTGFIYLSPDFPDGQFMMTAEVVNAGILESGVCYIETVDGFRFIVTAYAREFMESLLVYLAMNDDYFSVYRW